MTRLFLASLLLVCACDDGGNAAPTIDAGGPDAVMSDGGGGGADANGDPCIANGGADCFALPSAVLVGHEGANMQTPDNSCTPNPGTTTDIITLQGTVTDLTGAPAAGTLIELFYQPGLAGTPDATDTSIGDGTYNLTLNPDVPNSFDVRTTRAGALEMDIIGMQIFFSPTTQTGGFLGSWTATQWSGFLSSVNETPQAGDTGVLVVATDCDARTLEFAAITVSSTSSPADEAPTFVPGARVYYVNSPPTPALPADRHETSASGGAVILGLAPGSYYLQSWGFADDTALAMGAAGLTLVGEQHLTVAGGPITVNQLTPRSGP